MSQPSQESKIDKSKNDKLKTDKLNIVGVGEVLWDLLLTGPQLGGAPANFSYHAQALGAEAAIITRVGHDDYGREIIRRLGNMGLPEVAWQQMANRVAMDNAIARMHLTTSNATLASYVRAMPDSSSSRPMPSSSRSARACTSRRCGMASI